MYVCMYVYTRSPTLSLQVHMDADDATRGGPESATVDAAGAGVYRVYVTRVRRGAKRGPGAEYNI